MKFDSALDFLPRIFPAAFVAEHGPADILGVNMRLFEREALSGVQLLYPDGRNWSGTGPWDFVREGEIL